MVLHPFWKVYTEAAQLLDQLLQVDLEGADSSGAGLDLTAHAVEFLDESVDSA